MLSMILLERKHCEELVGAMTELRSVTLARIVVLAFVAGAAEEDIMSRLVLIILNQAPARLRLQDQLKGPLIDLHLDID